MPSHIPSLQKQGSNGSIKSVATLSKQKSNGSLRISKDISTPTTIKTQKKTSQFSPPEKFVRGRFDSFEALDDEAPVKMVRRQKVDPLKKKKTFKVNGNGSSAMNAAFQSPAFPVDMSMFAGQSESEMTWGQMAN